MTNEENVREQSGESQEALPADATADEETDVISQTPIDELAELTRERDQYLDALQRLKAEFDNFRKRA